MHSWVFRHRARLRLIYGHASPEGDLLPVDRVPSEARPSEAPAAPPSGKMRTRKHRLTPGTLARRGRWVLVAPMPPPPGR